jgi:eukaryotic-like serine/threonine-protein kinase
MYDPGNDRNLLFGLLALQMDLIDHRQFIEACTSWAVLKEGTLADFLIGRAWITAGDRNDIDRLLRRKLEKHGDVRHTLDATLNGRIAEIEGEEADFEVRSVISHLADRRGADVVETRDAPPQTRQRYPLARMHASGGLGRIWVARDMILGREVALKEIRPERADEPVIRARFLREARITGQLEHPNIVPVYELSHGGERAFYTMRLVQGRRLTDAIRDHHRDRESCSAGPLEMSGLLNTFIAVCNAVAYAHSRGVIHRDIKGQNVILGGFGEVIVLDWGLAKRVGRTDEKSDGTTVEDDRDELTLAGQFLGTPGYMSPEQIEGNSEAIGPASDIYGLGALLYEIVTGRPPFGGSGIAEVLRGTREEGPPPARRACPAVPPPLEAVCRKAMSKRPEDRFSSADGLADEVRRWLADEPLTCFRDPRTVRMGRWARRHRTTVAAASALLLASLVALSVGLVLADRSVRAEAAQRRRADANFRLARGLVDHLYERVLDDPLFQESRMDPLRRSLGKAVRDFYSELSDTNPDDPDLRYRLGWSHLCLGPILVQLGSTDDAIAQCRRAAEIFGPLAAEHPTRTDYRIAWSQAYFELGEAEGASGRVGEAETSYRASIRIAREVATLADNREAFRLAAVGLGGLAQVHANVHDWDQASSEYAEATTMWERVAGPGPSSEVPADIRSQLASCRRSLGQTLGMKGETERAGRLLREARETLATLAKEDPSRSHRYQLAQTDKALAKLSIHTGEAEAARKMLEEALELFSGLANQHPDVATYRSERAATLNLMGDLEKLEKER